MTKQELKEPEEKPAEKKKPDVLARYRHAEGCKLTLDRAQREYDEAQWDYLQAVLPQELLKLMDKDRAIQKRIDLKEYVFAQKYGKAAVQVSNSAAMEEDIINTIPEKHRMGYMQLWKKRINEQRGKSTEFRKRTDPFITEKSTIYLKWTLPPAGTVTKKGR